MTNNDKEDLRALLKTAELSGGQGRGWYGSRQGLFKTMKGLKKSKKLILRAFEKNKSIIYHTRIATQGKVKIENCHPFTIYGKKSNIVGVENGHFWVGEIDDKTDAHIIFKFLADFGIEKLVEKYQDEGWGSLVWFDLDKRKWFAIRLGNQLEVSSTDFGLVVATRTLWNKFDSGISIALGEAVLYELLANGVKPVKRFKKKRRIWHFKKGWWSDEPRVQEGYLSDTDKRFSFEKYRNIGGLG